VSTIIYELPEILTDYYEAYRRYYISLYNSLYNESEWVEKTGIITHIKNMTACYVNNLTDNILKDFERDVLEQLNDTNIDLNNAPQLLYRIKDEAIDRFEKLERGLCNNHYVAFCSI
jgi:hypothetical protein